MRSFKKKYLEELKKSKEKLPDGEVPKVNEIFTKPRGRHLLLGKFNQDVQMYIKALRKAGTPITGVPEQVWQADPAFAGPIVLSL